MLLQFPHGKMWRAKSAAAQRRKTSRRYSATNNKTLWKEENNIFSCYQHSLCLSSYVCVRLLRLKTHYFMFDKTTRQWKSAIFDVMSFICILCVCVGKGMTLYINIWAKERREKSTRQAEGYERQKKKTILSATILLEHTANSSTHPKHRYIICGWNGLQWYRLMFFFIWRQVLSLSFSVGRIEDFLLFFFLLVLKFDHYWSTSLRSLHLCTSRTHSSSERSATVWMEWARPTIELALRNRACKTF